MATEENKERERVKRAGPEEDEEKDELTTGDDGKDGVDERVGRSELKVEGGRSQRRRLTRTFSAGALTVPYRALFSFISFLIVALSGPRAEPVLAEARRDARFKSASVADDEQILPSRRR